MSRPHLCNLYQIGLVISWKTSLVARWVMAPLPLTSSLLLLLTPSLPPSSQLHGFLVCIDSCSPQTEDNIRTKSSFGFLRNKSSTRHPKTALEKIWYHSCKVNGERLSKKCAMRNGNEQELKNLNIFISTYSGTYQSSGSSRIYVSNVVDRTSATDVATHVRMNYCRWNFRKYTRMSPV